MPKGKILMSAEVKKDVRRGSSFCCSFSVQPLTFAAFSTCSDDHVYHDVPLVLYDFAGNSFVLNKW